MVLWMARAGLTKHPLIQHQNPRRQIILTPYRLGGTSPIKFSVHPHYIATQRSASDTSRLSDKDRILDVFDDLLWIYTFLLSLVISNAGS